jgi:hypothetical protein
LEFFPWLSTKASICCKYSSKKGFSLPYIEACCAQLVKGNELQQEQTRILPLPEVAYQWVISIVVFKRSMGECLGSLALEPNTL